MRILRAIPLISLSCTPIAAAPPQRIVAIGDLHGDREQALRVLQLAKIADPDGHWVGGNTILVQTGDTTDRGPDSRGVLRLVRQLQLEAPKSGGQVVALLGNHEAMNLMGDWRYVSEKDITSYGGLEARKTAFDSSGEDGAWLRQLPAVTKIQDTVFVHGGITPEWAKRGIEDMNQSIRIGFDTPNDAHKPDGPLWYRGYVQDEESVACPRLTEALTALDAKRMVVGHTTRKNGRIEHRCEGRLTVIDTGISAHYGGNLAAWESVGGDARAIYSDESSDLPDPQ